MHQHNNKTKPSATSDLERKLYSALLYAKNTCVLGSDNKADDLKRTHGWAYSHKYRYYQGNKYLKYSDTGILDHIISWLTSNHDNSANAVLQPDDATETKFHIIRDEKDWYLHVGSGANQNAIHCRPTSLHDPLADSRFRLTPIKKSIIKAMFFAIMERSGNCSSLAILAAKHLWENPAGINRIEFISMNYDHCFLVINRAGHLHAPDTWGDAWIIDPWVDHGIIYPAREFKSKIQYTRKFAVRQIKELAEIGFDGTKISALEQDYWTCPLEIVPGRDHYPTYDQHKRLEDYYQVGISEQELNDRDQYQSEHAAKLQPCLQQIESFKDCREWGLLFKAIKQEAKSKKATRALSEADRNSSVLHCAIL